MHLSCADGSGPTHLRRDPLEKTFLSKPYIRTPHHHWYQLQDKRDWKTRPARGCTIQLCSVECCTHNESNAPTRERERESHTDTNTHIDKNQRHLHQLSNTCLHADGVLLTQVHPCCFRLIPVTNTHKKGLYGLTDFDK